MQSKNVSFAGIEFIPSKRFEMSVEDKIFQLTTFDHVPRVLEELEEIRKYFKTIYQKHEETVTQLSDSGVSYSMPTLQGTYSTNTKLGEKGMKVARLEVDPSTEEGAAIYTRWFTDATYIGVDQGSGE